MSALPLVVAALSGATAAVATVADGALLASVPTVETPDSEPPSTGGAAAVTDRSLPARERAHRALAFLRVAAHGVTGGAIAVALSGDGAPSPVGGLVLLGAAIGSVLVTESIARALGDILRESATRVLSPFTRATESLLWPVVQLGSALDRMLQRFVVPPRSAEDARETAAEQFRQVVESEPSVSNVTRDLLLGVFDFGETTVSDVMVPRVDMIAIDRDTPWNEVVDRVRSAHHSRVPVYVGSVDEIVGVLYAKDLLSAVIADEEPGDDWPSLIREARYIPSTKRIADQLRDFKASHTHIAIVVDEYGGTEGMVTIEDILEELVGEIRDEYDDEERHIEEEDGVRYWVSGRLTLDELSDALEADFRRDEVSTIGGLIFELLGRVPRAGETLDIEGFRVIVERVVRRKVARVFLERRAGEPSSEDVA
jgi:putative hemolysin